MYKIYFLTGMISFIPVYITYWIIQKIFFLVAVPGKMPETGVKTGFETGARRCPGLSNRSENWCALGGPRLGAGRPTRLA